MCDRHLTMDEDPLESNEYYRDRPTKVQRKHKTGTVESGVDPGESSCKSTNTVELLPVVLRRQTERKLKAFNPIYVDYCLKAHFLDIVIVNLFMMLVVSISHTSRAGLCKYEVRLETILRGPTQWCVQKCLRSIKP